MDNYFTFSREELENAIRKIALQKMLSPSYGDLDNTNGYNNGVPYYNDGVRCMAEAVIHLLMPEEAAEESGRLEED